jgi:hypothetical protein
MAKPSQNQKTGRGCQFKPVITSITPVFNPTQAPQSGCDPNASIPIEHIFIVHGRNFGQVTPDDIVIADADSRFEWTVQPSTIAQDAHHIRVHATVARKQAAGHKGRAGAAAGAGSGDLTISVNTPPPNPGTGIRKGAKAMKTATELSFAVYYYDP